MVPTFVAGVSTSSESVAGATEANMQAKKGAKKVLIVDVPAEAATPLRLTSNGKIALIVDTKTGKLRRHIVNALPVRSPTSPRSPRLEWRMVQGHGSGRSGTPASKVNINQWVEQRGAKIAGRAQREKASLEDEQMVRLELKESSRTPKV